MLSPTRVHEATRHAAACGALQPIESQTVLLADGGVEFIVRAVSSLARKQALRETAAPADPLGEPDPALFVADLPPSHCVLLNKYPVLAGHLLLVTRRFEHQDSLLTVGDFAALAACLSGAERLAFYNCGAAAGASQPHKHLQLVPLPLAPGGPDEVPMERTLDAGAVLPFRRAHARLPPHASAADVHAVYRDLLHRCGISAAAAADGRIASAPYNLLVRPGWMMVVPRARACFESIAVNALGFAGSLFVRSREDLERVRAVGPMQILRAVAIDA
jgi:ATP adenylyltransferase